MRLPIDGNRGRIIYRLTDIIAYLSFKSDQGRASFVHGSAIVLSRLSVMTSAYPASNGEQVIAKVGC